mgnify:CR=1 FL=1
MFLATKSRHEEPHFRTGVKIRVHDELQNNEKINAEFSRSTQRLDSDFLKVINGTML